MRWPRLSGTPLGVMIEAARRQRILRKAEDELLRVVSRHSSQAAIDRAAEGVRRAMILLFKGQRELALYRDEKTDSELRHLANFERKTSEWREKSVEDIVRHCQARDA